jgi:uncharacterized membrane protein
MNNNLYKSYMKIGGLNILKEWKAFSEILWDQILLSIIFTIIIYFTQEDYNLHFTDDDTEYMKLWKCWHFCIVTQYTVGYGYVYPKTVRGEIVNSIHIVLSYYLLARDMTRVLN